MAEVRVSDLHLKKELIQIRKAARALRDPGTTSSWRSPLASSRSAAAMASVSDNDVALRNFPTTSAATGKDSKKRVFLYNWKNPKSSSEKSVVEKNDGVSAEDEEEEDDDDDDGDETTSFGGGGESVDDSLSDARNGMRRDASLVFMGTPLKNGRIKKRGKRIDSQLDLILSNYQKKNKKSLKNSRRLVETSTSLGLDSVEQSDETDQDYSNSDDIRRIRAASPLLFKLKKHKNWSHSNPKFLRTTSRGENSSYTYSTPALSTSSYNRYGKNRNPSTVGSCDGTMTSVNDGDDEVDDPLDLPGRQGCGIPCYWSKRMTPKHRSMCGGCYSPSFSDTLRRKGSSMLCGSRTMYARHHRASLCSNKQRTALRSAQGVLPLLANSGDGGGGSSIGMGRSDDELSTNFGELDLEGLSRLDGRRWSSSCRSVEGLEIVAHNGEGEEEGTPENSKSFSQKYRPMFFPELIGQNIVVQSLVNAISRGRIAPVYLFQGPRGTGKTSAARIFASALNCLAPDEVKPCGYCRECADFIAGKNKDFLEVDGTNKKGIDNIRHLVKNVLSGSSSASSRLKVLVIDECHLLSSKTWLAFLKFLEEPPQRVVFIFITTDIDNVPRTIQSRCQRYLFNKIKDGDIVARLRKISSVENLDVEPDALDLIALNADGSLRDAETMLEQLSLLGKRISKSLVNELVGVVSDEKLLELLELAMSSDTAQTVKRARELMDSGVDPMVLMSQLASLIMDIIAGTYNMVDIKVTEGELERLKNALKLLSEAEKQLRISSERSTWFTATLLQLGSLSSPDPNPSGSSRRQSYKTDDDPSSASREAAVYKSDVQYLPHKSTTPAGKKAVNGNPISGGDLSSQNDGLSANSKLYHVDVGPPAASYDNVMVGNMMIRCVNSENLDSLWAQCIERCHSKTLRQLLHTYGRLVSISEVEGVLIAYVAFADENIKSRAERFLSSITNSMEMVLRCNIEVRIIHLPGGEVALNAASPMGSERERKAVCSNPIGGYSNSYPLPNGAYDSASVSSELLAEGDAQTSDKGEQRPEIPMQRIESIIREQRLETAWLQAAEKGTPGSLSRLKPEKNQVLPQEGSEDQMELTNSIGLTSQQWEDELNRDLKALKTNNGKVLQKEQIGRKADRYPMSPSLLHDTSFMGTSAKDNLGYESGSGAGGCSGFFCWNSSKPQSKGKVRRTPVRPGKGGRFSLFGECAKPKKTECRFKR